MEQPVRVVAVLVWAGLWALVFVLDPGFGVVDQPALLIALTVLPQILLGYVVGMRATLCVLPLGVAWALIVHSDCVDSTSIDGECSVTAAGIFRPRRDLGLCLGLPGCRWRRIAHGLGEVERRPRLVPSA